MPLLSSPCRSLQFREFPRRPSVAARIQSFRVVVRRRPQPGRQMISARTNPQAVYPRIRRRMRALSERESASRTGASACPRPFRTSTIALHICPRRAASTAPSFPIPYKIVRKSLKTRTFKSLYFQADAHSLSLFSCKSFIYSRVSKTTGVHPQTVRFLDFRRPILGNNPQAEANCRKRGGRTARPFRPGFAR